MSAIETRFGTFNADPSDVIAMVDVMPGFESCRRFVLLSAPAIAPFTCVQGLDEPRPSFLALPPHMVHDAYAPALSDGDRDKLEAGDDASLLWLALVRIDGDRAFANLRAPLVINPKRMLGLQVVSANDADPIDHPLTLG